MVYKYFAHHFSMTYLKKLPSYSTFKKLDLDIYFKTISNLKYLIKNEPNPCLFVCWLVFCFPCVCVQIYVFISILYNCVTIIGPIICNCFILFYFFVCLLECMCTITVVNKDWLKINK